VSQHVRAVEDWAGVALFQRQAQGVRLTAEGRRLAPVLEAAFDRMSEAVRAIRAMQPRPGLNIAALPSVAQLWLQPRLGAVRAALPGVRVSVFALETPPDLRRNLFDLSLFIRAPGGGPGEVVLEEDMVFPVCAPNLAARLDGPEALAGEVLLSDGTWDEDWARWAGAAGVALPGAADGPRYSLYSMAQADAEAGAGVLIGHRMLVAGALGRGALVAPFGTELATGRALVLEVAPGGAPQADAVARLLAGSQVYTPHQARVSS